MSFGHGLDAREFEDPLKYQSSFKETESAKNIIAYAQKSWNGIENADEAYKSHVEQVDMNIASLRRKAAADTFGERLLAKSIASQEQSSWLMQRTLPGQLGFERQLDSATKLFGLSAIGKSQRTKRGKKFEEKAALQAEMANQMRGYLFTREASLDYVLEHGRNFALGEDRLFSQDENAQLNGYGFSGEIVTFFNKANSNAPMKENDMAGEMAKDISMYSVATGVEMTDDARYASVWKGSLDLSDLQKDSAKFSLYNRVLNRLDNLDFSQFDYKSNEAFAMGKAEKSFAARFSTLRYFSHCVTMLDEMEKAGVEMPKNAKALRVKAEFIKEILADYENRALLIQSPFFALLASRDFDSFSVQELEMRRDRTSDALAKEYLDNVIKQKRAKGGFERGASAEAILQKKLEQAENAPEEQQNVEQEVVQQDVEQEEEQQNIEEEVEQQVVQENVQDEKTKKVQNEVPESIYSADKLAAMAEAKAKPRTINDELACKSLPFVVDKTAGDLYCQNFKQRILNLHRTMNAEAAASFVNHHAETQIVKLYVEVDSKSYRNLLEDQQTLENFRAKIAYLADLANASLPEDAAFINKYMDSILESPEYKDALASMERHATALEESLEEWQSQAAQDSREQELRKQFVPGYFNEKSYTNSWVK